MYLLRSSSQNRLINSNIFGCDSILFFRGVSWVWWWIWDSFLFLFFLPRSSEMGIGTDSMTIFSLGFSYLNDPYASISILLSTFSSGSLTPFLESSPFFYLIILYTSSIYDMISRSVVSKMGWFDLLSK